MKNTDKHNTSPPYNTYRLCFTDAERADPALIKTIRKADKDADKLEVVQAKIHKKKMLKARRTVDAETGKSTVRLCFEEIDRKKPPSKLTHAVRDAPVNAALSQFHREIRQGEADNVGVEAAHKSEETAELSVRAGRSAYRSHKLKPYRKLAIAESRLDQANLGYLQKNAAWDNFQPSRNPFSHWRQKQAVKKQYAAAKHTGQTADYASKAAENTAKAAKAAVRESKRAAAFAGRHSKGFLIVAAVFVVLALFLNAIFSCSVLLEGGMSGVVVSTYPSSDEAMLGAEAAYAAMEADLQNEVDNYETLHSGYDEYRYDLDEIGHDPYVLISLLTAWQAGEWTLAEVQDTLSVLFSKQYQLTQTVTTETNGKTSYTVCTVTLHNENLSHLPVFIMDEDKVGMYAMYMSTLGNRLDLFPASVYPNASTKKEYTDYDIPPAALKDERFAAIITEAEKYLGYPYVWGGSSPKTSFDCSGFVSWVINHSGWNVGRLGAQGLYNICTPVSAANAKPGDLVFLSTPTIRTEFLMWASTSGMA